MIRVICGDISPLTEPEYQRLYEKATQDRKLKADRYRRQEDSLRCVAADALLRYALGNSDYVIEKTSSGKPFIRGRENFHFNLSHAGNWVVMAYGHSEVGVDVETVRMDTNIEAIARRFFAPEEQSFVFQEEADRHQRFFRIWTGKESYVKYLGTGLNMDLASFSVLSMDQGIRIHHRMLPDGSHLSLCITEHDYLFELLDLRRL